jgi:CDP-glucose 4,6-dehydratase
MREFWNGRSVLVTGHTGFKGSWLCLWLEHLGANVTGFALAPPSERNLFQSAQVASQMHSVLGDIREPAAILKAMHLAKPEVVIHMAAQSLVRYSYQHPLETFSTNVMGTAHVLNAVRATDSVKAVVVVTSDKCYDNKEWPWGYRENEAMGGHDPYSSSKGCAELVTAAYRNSFFSDTREDSRPAALATARAGNVIGGGDWAQDRLVPDIVRAFEQRVPVVLRNPGAVRPWQHVLEPLRGYLMLAEALTRHGSAFAEPWNFGPADSDVRSVEWIVETLARNWGDQPQWQLDSGTHPHEAHTLRLDCAKARLRLSWQPKWQLERALEEIVAWHTAEKAGKSMRAVTLGQIEAYSNE